MDEKQNLLNTNYNNDQKTETWILEHNKSDAQG